MYKRIVLENLFKLCSLHLITSLLDTKFPVLPEELNLENNKLKRKCFEYLSRQKIDYRKLMWFGIFLKLREIFCCHDLWLRYLYNSLTNDLLLYFFCKPYTNSKIKNHYRACDYLNVIYIM